MENLTTVMCPICSKEGLLPVGVFMAAEGNEVVHSNENYVHLRRSDGEECLARLPENILDELGIVLNYL